MFYSHYILAKRGPLGTIWIAAHLDRRLRKQQITETDVALAVRECPTPSHLFFFLVPKNHFSLPHTIMFWFFFAKIACLVPAGDVAGVVAVTPACEQRVVTPRDAPSGENSRDAPVVELLW